MLCLCVFITLLSQMGEQAGVMGSCSAHVSALCLLSVSINLYG